MSATRNEWAPILIRGGVFDVKVGPQEKTRLFVFTSRDFGVLVMSLDLKLMTETPHASVGICGDEFSEKYSCRYAFIETFQDVKTENCAVHLTFENFAVTLETQNVQTALMWGKAFQWLLLYCKSKYFLKPGLWDISDVDYTMPSLKFSVQEPFLGECDFRIVHVASSKEFTAQFIPLDELANTEEYTKEQIEFFAQWKHSNLVCYVGAMGPDDRGLWIVSEYSIFGSVQSLFTAAKVTCTEEHARFIAHGVVRALMYLHANNITHSCVRPYNIFVDGSAVPRLGPIKASKWSQKNGQLNDNKISNPTTSLYDIGPPEKFMENGGVGIKSDIWELGVCLLDMVTRTLPFAGKTEAQVKKLLKKNDTLPLPQQGLSSNLREFIDLCVARDPYDRPALDELLEHPFLTNNNNNKRNPLVSVILQAPTRSYKPAVSVLKAEAKVTNRETWNATKEASMLKALADEKKAEAAKSDNDEPSVKEEEEEGPIEPSKWRVILSPDDVNYMSIASGAGKEAIPPKQSWIGVVTDSYYRGGMFDEHRVYAITLKMQKSPQDRKGKADMLGEEANNGDINESLIERRYNDFLMLFEVLSDLYPLTLVPPIPEKTALAAVVDEITTERMRWFEWFLSKLAKNPALQNTPEVAMFLMADRRTLNVFRVKERIIALKWKEGQERTRRSNEQKNATNGQEEEVHTSYRPVQPNFWETLVGDATTVTEYQGERMFDDMFQQIDGLKIGLTKLQEAVRATCEATLETSLAFYSLPYEMHKLCSINSVENSNLQHVLGGCLLAAKASDRHAAQLAMKLIEPLQYYINMCTSAMDLLDRHGYIVYTTLQTGFAPHLSKKNKNPLDQKQREDLIETVSNDALQAIGHFHQQRNADLGHVFLQTARTAIQMEKEKQTFWEGVLSRMEAGSMTPADPLYQVFASKDWQSSTEYRLG